MKNTDQGYYAVTARLHEQLPDLDINCLLLLKQVAQFLQVSLRTVQRRCREGKLLYVKVKRAVRVPLSALLQYIEENLVAVR